VNRQPHSTATRIAIDPRPSRVMRNKVISLRNFCNSLQFTCQITRIFGINRVLSSALYQAATSEEGVAQVTTGGRAEETSQYHTA
jgi:hypothetical protein